MVVIKNQKKPPTRVKSWSRSLFVRVKHNSINRQFEPNHKLVASNKTKPKDHENKTG
jgi:hypothetical protein